MAQIMDRLGPPSQMIEVGDQTMLYYLLEQSEGSSLFLLVYSTQTVRVKYDRAVFMCDTNGVLREMSVSREAVGAEVPPEQEP